MNITMATKPQPVQPIGCVAFFIIGMIILGIIKCISGSTDKAISNETSSYEPPSDNMAYIQSTDFVKQYLKSPSTADFDMLSGNPDVTSLPNNEYVVSYHFDAENGFGAKIRSDYTCSLKYLASSASDINNWELERLIIDGQEVKSDSKTFEKTSKKASIAVPKSNDYHIEQEVGNSYNLKVYVYLSNRNKVNEVNKQLVELYKDKYSQSLQIYYFDKRNFADYYFKSLDNPNVSDAKYNQLDKHLIATWDQEKGSDSDLDINN